MDGRDCLVLGGGILSSGREGARAGKRVEVVQVRLFGEGGWNDGGERAAMGCFFWRSAVCILAIEGAARCSWEATVDEEMFLMWPQHGRSILFGQFRNSDSHLSSHRTCRNCQHIKFYRHSESREFSDLGIYKVFEGSSFSIECCPGILFHVK